MSQKESNNIHYSAQDIARYHQGLMSMAERNALERAALEDPFLVDAMEGYKTGDLSANESALQNIRQRLESRVNPEKKRSAGGYVWWAAASVVFILGVGLFWYVQTGKSKKALVAAEVKTPAETLAPTPAPTPSAQAPAAQPPMVQVPATVARGDQPPMVQVPATVARGDQPPVVQANAGPKKPPPAMTLPASKLAIRQDSNEVAQADLQNNVVTNRLTLSNNGPAGNAAFSNNAQKVNVNRKVFQVNAPATGASPLTSAVQPAPNTARDTMTPVEIASAASKYNVSTPNLFKLTDTDRKPIQYASIQILPHGYTTTTDYQGYFTLPDQDSSAQVAFTAIGFQEKSMYIRDVSKAQTITLFPKASSLDEVVVTGYGTPKKYAEYAKKAAGPYHSYADSVGVQPMDGWEHYSNYLVANMQVPTGVKNYHIHGEVALSFQVDQNGHPYNISVEHSLCVSCDAEAIRLVKAGPTWKISGKAKKKKRGWIRIHF